MQTERTRIRLKHVPRARPRWDRVQGTLWKSLKPRPEQWRQISSRITSRKGLPLRSLDVDLFVPSTLIFSLTESIPFHVHISGSVSALQQLGRHTSVGDFSDPSVGSAESLHVSIIRQFIVQLPGPLGSCAMPAYRGVHNVILGEARLKPLPPCFDMASLSTTKHAPCDGWDGLDWEGEVSCTSEKAGYYGGFKSEYLAAKDFIMFSFKPKLTSRRGASCDDGDLLLEEHRFYQSIRLVTDSFSD